MRCIGNNDKLGIEKARISGDRVVKPVQEKTERFPLGVKGMVPVSTTKKGGGVRTVYVFRDAEDIQVLGDVVAQLDLLMARAEELVECSFGRFEEVRVGLKSPGYQFCHVEYTPFDKRGFAMDTPVTLYVRNPIEARAPQCQEAVVEYDVEGRVVRAAVDVYREGGYLYRLTALPREKNEALCVHKVETLNAKGSARLLYKLR